MVGIAIRNPDDGAKTRLHRAFGREERVGDLRFADNPSRGPNREACIVAVTTVAEHGAAPLMASLAGRGAPFSRVDDHENPAAEGQPDTLGVIESGDGTACSAFRGCRSTSPGAGAAGRRTPPTSASAPARSWANRSATARASGSGSSPTPPARAGRAFGSAVRLLNRAMMAALPEQHRGVACEDMEQRHGAMPERTLS